VAAQLNPAPARAMAGIAMPSRTLAIVIIALALVRVAVAATTGLTDDEAYYRLWAIAPAVSYYDHPPMVAWMIAAGRWLLGDTPLGIRLAGPLIALIGPLVLWRTTAILFDRETAERSVWLALAMPLLAVGGVVITPDTPSVLFWGLAAWAVAELYASDDGNWWLAVGLFCGLGLLSKYTNLFAGVGVALWIVLLPENRRWLRSGKLWAACALALVIALPVVVWNAEHQWASFAKQFGRVVVRQPASARYLLELVGAYLGLASPVIAVLAAIGLWRAVRFAATGKSQPCLMLATMLVPFLGYLLVHAVHDRVQPNWMAPIYPMLAICAALALSAMPRRDAVRLLRAGLGVGLSLCALIYVQAVYPLFSPAGMGDPTSQMRGWREFAAEVERVRLANGARWIATASYATTGQLAFALKGGPEVVQLNERVRYAHLAPPERALLNSPALYVDLERRSGVATLGKRFASVTALGTLSRSFRGQTLARYALYRLADPIAPVLDEEGRPEPAQP
jgi:4-amino-4-deoxy-L-arabinose transferase-like glycosyltransferase